jgi:CHASE3 domain sensor protein
MANALHRRLKLKIFTGFMLLVAMLALAGTISIIEFIKLSRSFTSIIDDNYKSIEASKSMLEVLEREDSGYLLLLLGQTSEGKKIINSADSSFAKAFDIARNNITEENENQYIDNISNAYMAFNLKLMKPIMDTSSRSEIDIYKTDVHISFLNAKYAVNKLMDLNQTSMHKEAGLLKDKSYRAIVPGIVAIIASLVFALLLSFFISIYFVRPIIKLTESIRKYRPGVQVFDFDIKSEDEIKTLEQ